MMSTACKRGFSLVEVVIALGVFSIAILSLVAVVGPLLSGLRDVREQAYSAQLIALTNGWLRAEAAIDYETTRDRFSPGGEGAELYLYLWAEGDGQARWKATDRGEWRGDFARHRVGAFHFRSAIHLITLKHDASLHPDAVSSEEFRVLRATIASAAAGGPDRTPGAVEGALENARSSGTFFTVFHR